MSKQLKADLSIFSITIIWGSSFIVMKNISDDIPAYAYLAMRFLVASIILAIVFNKRLKGINLGDIMRGSLIAVLLYAGMMLQVLGLKTTTASNSAFITGLCVIMVPIISVFLLKKRPPVNAVIGVFLAAVGLFFLTGFQGNWVKGDTLTLICAICFALQIIFIDKFASDMNIYHLAFIQVAATAVFYLITWAGVAFTSDNPDPIAFDSKVILTILYTGALGTAFGYSVQTIAQKYTTPTRTALILTCEPVFGAIFALIVPDIHGNTEVLTIQTIIGSLLILSGMVITELKFRKNIL
ncbi:MAG TPA: DMT family transporter [Clostridiaceae bacterium]|jgi:drug/metabolite transporter (DMT)-like permease|nr:DMT family transporter [Clostridiaceae bacterium]